jgi:hypothetical protein
MKSEAKFVDEGCENEHELDDFEIQTVHETENNELDDSDDELKR